MTYLIIRTSNTPSIETLFTLSGCGFQAKTAEHHERLVPDNKNSVFSLNADSSDEDASEPVRRTIKAEHSILDISQTLAGIRM